MTKTTRRDLMRLAAGAALAAAPGIASERFGPIMTFAKHLQWLSFDELARFLEEIDLDGIEATVRKGGQVEPENVERDLPLLVEALEKRGRKVVMVTTDVNDADDPLSRRVVRTADNLGIRWFRMAYYRYNSERPILEQIDGHRESALRLAEFLKDYRITGLYQNHAGSRVLGGTVWDMLRLLDGVPEDRVSAIFDVRHATADGGTSASILWRVIRSRVRIVYMKDFQWQGRNAVNVPMGTGMVDPELLRMVRDDVEVGTPVSLHMEYIDHRDPDKQKECMDAIARDRRSLRHLIGA